MSIHFYTQNKTPQWEDTLSGEKKEKLSSPELKTTHSREIASLSKRAAAEDESGRPDGTSPKSFLDLSIWSRAHRKHLQKGLRGNLDGDWENLPSVTFKQSNRGLWRGLIRNSDCWRSRLMETDGITALKSAKKPPKKRTNGLMLPSPAIIA